MEIIKLGKDESERDVLLDAVLRYCRYRDACKGCPLRYELCRGPRKYRTKTEWKLSELREAFRIIGEGGNG